MHFKDSVGLGLALAGFVMLSIGDAVIKTIAGSWPGTAVALTRHTIGAVLLVTLLARVEGRRGFRVRRWRWQLPGRVRQRRNGSMLVPATESGADFVRLFDNSPIEAQTTEDWLTAAWRKLAINCGGAVSALTLRPAAIANDPEAAQLILALVRECVAVGRAEGANLTDGLTAEVVEHYRQSPADSVNSIHADRLAGRPTEADARNGVIARLGAQHGIATPFNHMADVLLRISRR